LTTYQRGLEGKLTVPKSAIFAKLLRVAYHSWKKTMPKIVLALTAINLLANVISTAAQDIDDPGSRERWGSSPRLRFPEPYADPALDSTSGVIWPTSSTTSEVQVPGGWTGEPPQDVMGGPPVDLRQLLRPRVKLRFEWEPLVDGVGLAEYDASVSMPTYPVFGPPPPIITAAYSFTDLTAPPSMDLPSSLHDISLGAGWIRRINERWMARLMLSAAFASDLNNTGSDAWQLRAGGFAVYRPNSRWSFAVGAIATGRDDLPVIPAAGAIWEPSPNLKVDLMMPNPKVAILVADYGTRQHWAYFGGGFAGGTWAYERMSGAAERLTYREWRLVLGWEARPPQPPGTFAPLGVRYYAEVGYIFGRRFEFDSDTPTLNPEDTLLLLTGFSF
jgi:hypothetical protein